MFLHHRNITKGSKRVENRYTKIRFSLVQLKTVISILSVPKFSTRNLLTQPNGIRLTVGAMG